MEIGMPNWPTALIFLIVLGSCTIHKELKRSAEIEIMKIKCNK